MSKEKLIHKVKKEVDYDEVDSSLMEVPKKKLSTKRSRAKYEEGSNSSENRLQSENLGQLTSLDNV